MRLKPFAAIRPTPDSAASVACVPYDVVDRDEAKAMASGRPDSFLRVVRSEVDFSDDTDPYADEVYARAASNLDAMLERGVLVRDDDASLYIYRLIMNGVAQTGIVGCVHIDDYENDLIKKHEKTRPAKENDRTRHIKQLRAGAEPVILAYREIAHLTELVRAAVESEPLLDFVADDGVQHTVWRAENTDSIVAAFRSVPEIYVADGHHRCASAWRAGKEMREQNPSHDGTENYNWFHAALFSADELNILPYNRAVRDLNGLDADALRHELSEVGRLDRDGTREPPTRGSFCFYIDGAWHQLTVDPDSIDENDPIRSLDADLLQTRVLTPILGIGDPRTDARIEFIGGIRGSEELERRVDNGDFALGIAMYPTTMEEVFRVSDSGNIMPPKSTWFEPKLRSGLFVHAF